MTIVPPTSAGEDNSDEELIAFLRAQRLAELPAEYASKFLQDVVNLTAAARPPMSVPLWRLIAADALRGWLAPRRLVAACCFIAAWSTVLIFRSLTPAEQLAPTMRTLADRQTDGQVRLPAERAMLFSYGRLAAHESAGLDGANDAQPLRGKALDQ